jgi:hypothetical protein
MVKERKEGENRKQGIKACVGQEGKDRKKKALRQDGKIICGTDCGYE